VTSEPRVTFIQSLVKSRGKASLLLLLLLLLLLILLFFTRENPTFVVLGP
jgi:hypothetical protein